MELLISPLRLCGHVYLQLRWVENELWAFDWCPAPLLAIVSPAETEQSASAACAPMIHAANRNILNPSDWDCPINPNIDSH